ncbi:MAG: transposase, partial [Gammaproteobacteria bacterium]
MTTVLAERVKEWTEQWKQAGLEQGRQEGREEGRQEGRQEGRLEGFQEGRQEGVEQGTRRGELALLKRLLVHRFGPLPDWVEVKLEGADTAALEGWAERILEAQELEAVFRD